MTLNLYRSGGGMYDIYLVVCVRLAVGKKEYYISRICKKKKKKKITLVGWKTNKDPKWACERTNWYRIGKGCRAQEFSAHYSCYRSRRGVS